MGDTGVRRALIVLGMHRSGTSAMAGLLGEMGCDLPADLMAPQDMNAKGFFESNRITQLNEDLLASAGMTWYDMNRFPETWYDTPKASEFRALANAAVLADYGSSGLFVMKDPRTCRLVPFWEGVLADQGVQPAYVCIHRNPGEVSASLTKWAGYEPIYGQLLWLRHVLDAEHATRGKTRVFVTYDQVLADWRSLVARIAASLDVVFPRSVQTAARGAQQFVSPDLRHLSLGSLDLPRLEEMSDWVADTLQVLSRWSDHGESASDHATLDRIRAALDAASDTMVPAIVELLHRYHEVAHLRKELAATAGRIATLTAQVDEQGSQGRKIEKFFQGRIAIMTEQLEATRARLVEQDQALAELSTRLAEANTSLANSETTIGVVNNTLHETWLKTQSLSKELEDQARELYKARSRPLGNLGKFVEYRSLRLLSKSSSPLPSKMKAKFLRSAEKRDPDRFLPKTEIPVAAKVGSTAEVLSRPGLAQYRAALETVIVVSHDASRTGAPILALNMAQALSQRYNVVVVCLRDGELSEDFRQVSTAFYIVEHAARSDTSFVRLLEEVSATKPPLFAVVNSIEARGILGALRKLQIPSVALFHEFASYTLPRSAFTDAFHLADQIVFSTELTIRNALVQASFERSPRFHVLAQGRCVVPRHDDDDAARKTECERLTSRLRPNGDSAGEFLVVGAGYVQIRKGVDLFIDVARRVLSTEAGKNARFAWIGAGYDPERDAAYSVYLSDQIARAGLEDRMVMLPETSEIDHVYGLADLLLLTSRLDPLPNVAIDALSEGIPVVCFDKTTGVADLLTDAGLRDDCVADYIDTEQAAEKVLNFIRSPDAYDQVCQTARDFATRRFDFDAYARQIEQLGLGIRKGWSNRPQDVSTIAASDCFDPAFMSPQQKLFATRTEAAEFYVTENWHRTPSRRPEPGFNPLVYAQHLASAGAGHPDGYAEFLRRGRPAGPWLRNVIRESDSTTVPEGRTPPRTALHIHAHYPDVVAKIAGRLARNQIQPDLFINAPDGKSLDLALETLKDFRGRIAEARVVVNRGRDIGPFLTEFGSILVRDYDLIGHLHTKKSVSLSDRAFVDRWVDFLYENMIGGAQGGAMMDRIAAAFAQDDHLGIVFPADPNILAWSSNEDAARRLAPRLGLETLPDFIDFPMGSMLWIRAAALQPFVALDLGWNDYPPEPVNGDGTILHAIERLFGVVAEARGMNIAVSNVKGMTR